MGNKFAELMSDGFKKIHKQMIDGLIDAEGCSVECTLIYSSSRFESCGNCLYDPIGGKSSNRFLSGGPSPFHHGVCPVCGGRGKITTTETDTIYAMPIWDSKDWTNLSQGQVNMADIDVQTMSKITDYSKLKQTSQIIIDTSIADLGIPRFTRIGDPEICGLGQSTHIITSWKRS